MVSYEPSSRANRRLVALGVASLAAVAVVVLSRLLEWSSITSVWVLLGAGLALSVVSTPWVLAERPNEQPAKQPRDPLTRSPLTSGEAAMGAVYGPEKEVRGVAGAAKEAPRRREKEEERVH